MSYQKNAGAVRRFGKVMKFAAWLQNLPNKLTPPPFRLMQIGSAFWQSRVLYVAARLDVATILGDDALPVELMAQRVSAQADALHRLLRMLSAIGVFAETSPGVYKNNRLSAYLRLDHPQSVRAMILLHNSDEMSLPWFEHLEHALRTGEVAFEKTHGQPLYAHMNGHAEFDALFARAMDSVEALGGDHFATDFAWERFERVIDVGGSKGSKAIAILKRHQQLTALVFDREAVIRNAAGYWNDKATPQLLNRLSFQAGDLLESVPAAQSEKDIYLLSAVFHGMDDATCLQILSNLAAVCADTGARVAVLEMIVAESNADFVSAAFDMQMLVNTRGRERTVAQWKNLFDKVGMVLEEVVELQSFGSLLVLRSVSLKRVLHL